MSKFVFMGSPLWSILVCKIPEFWRWKLWDQNFVPFDSGNMPIKESKESSFPFSVELTTKFVWSYGLLFLPSWNQSPLSQTAIDTILQKVILLTWLGVCYKYMLQTHTDTHTPTSKKECLNWVAWFNWIISTD